MNEHLLSREELIQRLQDAEASYLEKDVELESLKKTMTTYSTDFDPKSQIAIIWSVEDVLSVRSDLSDEQAMEVLKRVKDKHDADIGVNWATLECVADILFSERGTFPLVCNKCGYKQRDLATIQSFQTKNHNKDVDSHDIAYFCGACLDNCSDEEHDVMRDQIDNGFEWQRNKEEKT